MSSWLRLTLCRRSTSVT